MEEELGRFHDAQEAILRMGKMQEGKFGLSKRNYLQLILFRDGLTVIGHHEFPIPRSI